MIPQRLLKARARQPFGISAREEEFRLKKSRGTHKVLQSFCKSEGYTPRNDVSLESNEMKTPSIIRRFLLLGFGMMIFLAGGCQRESSPQEIPLPSPPAAPAATTTPAPASLRAALSYETLTRGRVPDEPVSMSALGMPDHASEPTHRFEGRLTLRPAADTSRFSLLKDPYHYADNIERRRLPILDIEFVQEDSYLIPVQRGLVISDHPYWNYIISPGRVWDEAGDSGDTRAAFPFALVEKNANCVHNGVITFLFNEDNVSHAYYQITQETCMYFQGDFWGMLSAAYTPSPVAGAEEIREAYRRELAGQMPVKPFSALAEDYPGINLRPFTSGLRDITVYGLVYNGVHYLGGGDTRYGTFPFLQYMRLPSYSAAKSAFAGIVYMRLGEKYGDDIGNLLIREYVPEYADSIGNWDSVTLDQTLDMATGNYDSPAYEKDENGRKMSRFFSAESYAEKIALAFDWENQSPAGTIWVYHTSDIFLATQAMQGYLQTQEGEDADIFDFLVEEVYRPIGIGEGAYTTLRTSENHWQGRPIGGYGLFWIPDDIAKISVFLNVNGGAVNGEQILSPTLLAKAMQRDPSDRGLKTGRFDFRYNNAFWGHEFTRSDGYDCDFWVPFMSGYGGITIAMMPNEKRLADPCRYHRRLPALPVAGFDA